MRQAENKCYIEGILSEVDLKTGSFEKDGKPQEYISGNIKIKVTQEINGEMKELEVPVRTFATRYTKKGTDNPAYNSIKNVMNEFTSIAAAGSEELADRVRITSGNLVQNEYYSQDGRLVSFPQISASFINKIKTTDCKPKATFNVEMFVAAKNYEVDKDGVETGRYQIKGVVPQYGGKVDVINFIGASKGVVDAISNYWEVGKTFKATGKLNFSSETKTYYEEVDFGDPIEKTSTFNVSELIITGGSQTPLDEDFGFDAGEIKSALAERKERLERDKVRDRKPIAPKPNKNDFNDLGF